MALPRPRDTSMSESDMVALINRAVPAHTFQSVAHREWTWSGPAGLWKINLTMSDAPTPSRLSARLVDGFPSLHAEGTRRQVDAMLRWLVTLNAIDRHPDDPQAA